MSTVLGLRGFLRPYWRECFLSLILLIVVVILDLAIPRLVQQIIDQGILAGDVDVVLRTFLLMLGISVANTAFAIGNNYFSVRAGEGVARDLRESVFVKIQSLSFGNLDRLRTGQLMVRLSSDTGVLQRLVQISLRIGTRAPLIMVGSVILMFRTSRGLALLITPILAVAGVVIVLFAWKMSPLFLTMQQKLDRLNSVLHENIAGVRLVKVFVRAGREAERFEVANQDYTDRNIRVMQFMASMGPALSVCVNVAVVLVIWSGGLRAMRGQLTPGQIVAFVNYLQTGLGPLMIMVNLANVWAAGIVSAGRLQEVLTAVPEVADAAIPECLPDTDALGVAFEDVAFRYAGSTQTVLEHVNLSAAPGQTVAILGATGSGKTSLVNLIPRFYDVTSGRILVGGFDVRSVRHADLRARIAVVPQETVLFSGSVRDNIRFGRPQAGEEEVTAAAVAAQAHDFIMELPAGYDTRVEERGVNLSGGQKQRIAIARALLRRPAILILDDSTSSVDVLTEARLQDAMGAWMRGRTIFVVAQRISTVLKADKIVVIDKGHVAAEGSHRVLLASSRIYREIYATQLGGEEGAAA